MHTNKVTGRGALPLPNEVDDTIYDSWVVPATQQTADKHYRLEGLEGSKFWYLIPRAVIHSTDPVLYGAEIKRMEDIIHCQQWQTRDW